jgi:hypothetical protein
MMMMIMKGYAEEIGGTSVVVKASAPPPLDGLFVGELGIKVLPSKRYNEPLKKSTRVRREEVNKEKKIHQTMLIHNLLIFNLPCPKAPKDAKCSLRTVTWP